MRFNAGAAADDDDDVIIRHRRVNQRSTRGYLYVRHQREIIVSGTMVVVEVIVLVTHLVVEGDRYSHPESS